MRMEEVIQDATDEEVVDIAMESTNPIVVRLVEVIDKLTAECYALEEELKLNKVGE